MTSQCKSPLILILSTMSPTLHKKNYHVPSKVSQKEVQEVRKTWVQPCSMMSLNEKLITYNSNLETKSKLNLKKLVFASSKNFFHESRKQDSEQLLPETTEMSKFKVQIKKP